MKSKNHQTGKGQTLVEFALIIPLFILMVMFIFDIGRGVYYYSVMYNAVREGARFATVKDPDPDGSLGIKSQINNKVLDMALGIDLDSTDVTISWTGVDVTPNFVTVSASYDYYPITPIVSAFLPGNKLDLDVQTSMRLEFD